MANDVLNPPDGQRTRPIPEELRPLLARFAGERWEDHIRMAESRLKRLRIDPIGLVAEGAVSLAWIVLGERIARGGMRAIDSLQDLDRVFTATLFRVIVDERRRQCAQKRGRSRAVSLSRLEEDGFECADAAACTPEERAIVEDEIASFLEPLDRKDPSLRAVVLLKLEDLSIEQIAAALGLRVWEVKRKLSMARILLGPGWLGLAS